MVGLFLAQHTHGFSTSRPCCVTDAATLRKIIPIDDRFEPTNHFYRIHRNLTLSLFAFDDILKHIDITESQQVNTSYINALPKEWEAMSAIFVAMGDPQRQRLLLAFEPGERLTAGQLTEASPLSRTTVSHHLKILRQSGVLGSEKIGKEVYFWVNREAVVTALTNVLNYVNA